MIDYQSQDFTDTENRYDFIFDAVGKISFKKSKPLLTEKGVYISTELGKNGANLFLALYTPVAGKKKVLFPIPTIDKNMLQFFSGLVQSGEFKPVIDRRYPLDQIVAAYEYVETEQKTGNVILRIAHS